MKLPYFILLLILSFSLNVQAETHHCFPNNRAFSPGLVGTELVSETQSRDIFRQLLALYSQDVAAQGGRLDIAEIDTMEFDAFANQTIDGDFLVRMTKGVRFQQEMTVDGYT